jgi:transposase
VPAQDGGRADQEQSAGRQPAPERGQDHAIGRAPARWSSGASEDEQLSAEDEELEIPIGFRAASDDEDVDQQAEEGVEESQEHRAASVGVSAVLVKPPTVACRRVEAWLSEGGGEAASPPGQTDLCTPRAMALTPIREVRGSGSFLRRPELGVPATNWRAEQGIRPAVMIRKTWGGNATWIGAGTQERLMSVCRTGRQQGVDVIEALTELQRQPQPELLPGPDHPGARPGSGR